MRDLIGPLFRRKRILLLTWLGLVLATVLLAIHLNGVYAASMSVLVNRVRFDSQISTGQVAEMSTAALPVTEEEINSEIQLLQSSDLLRRIVLDHGLANAERHSIWARLMPRQPDGVYVDKAVKHLGDRIKIAQVTQSNVITATYKSSDPQLCYAVVKQLSQLYLEKHIEVNRAHGAYDFFAQQTDLYRNELAAAEDRLKQFNIEHGAAAADAVRTDLATHLNTAVAQYETASDQARASAERLREDEAQLGTTAPRATTAEIDAPADVLSQQLSSTLLTSQLKREALVAKYDPSYPLVQEADQEISTTEAAIKAAESHRFATHTTDRDATYELLRADIAKTRADLHAETVMAQGLDSDVRNTKARLTESDQLAITQSALLRDVQTNEADFTLYQGKREQERASNALDAQRISNVAIADAPSVPSLPAYNPLLVILLGFVGATVLSVAVVYVFEYADASLQTPEDVSTVLNLPVLASFPKRTA